MESKAKKCLEEEGPRHKPAAATISLVFKQLPDLMIFIGNYLLTDARSGMHFCVTVLLAQCS